MMNNKATGLFFESYHAGVSKAEETCCGDVFPQKAGEPVKDLSCNELLIQFMKHYLINNCISFSQPLSEQQIKELYVLSCKHDVAHLVGVVAEKLPADQRSNFRPFAREQMKAMFRHEKMQQETEKIFALLEACGIPFVPLKGAAIRPLYHEPWHRTSGDVDILVSRERLDEAIGAARTQLKYENKGFYAYDVSLWSPNGIHFELHFDFAETHVNKDQFWENAVAEPGHYCHRLSNEMLILAHVAHMAKHFLVGGCGLRPFLDLWFMQEKLSYDEARLKQMLQDAGLQSFYVKVNELLDAWFHDGKKDGLLTGMEEYVLYGGVYGNQENIIVMKRARGYSSVRYLLERLFPPVDAMKYRYLVLNKHPWLLPWFWLCRAARHVKNGKAWRIGAEFRINRDFSKEDFNNADQLLKGLGLKG